MDCSPPGFSVHGISQARILEWVEISISRGAPRSRDQTRVSFIGEWILYYEPPGKPTCRHYTNAYCSVVTESACIFEA